MSASPRVLVEPLFRSKFRVLKIVIVDIGCKESLLKIVWFLILQTRMALAAAQQQACTHWWAELSTFAGVGGGVMVFNQCRCRGRGRQPALSAGLRDPASIHSTEEKQVADHSEGPGPGPGCRTLARFAASLTRHVWLASLRSDAATPMAIALDRALGT